MSIEVKRLKTREELKALEVCGLHRLSGEEACLVLSPDRALFTPERLHFVRNAVSRIRAVTTIVEHGYRFEDEQAAGYLDLLKQAHAALDQLLLELEPLFVDAEAERASA